MSIFEYLMVMTSVVLALALAQLLRGVTEIFLNPKAYLAHGIWLVTIIFMIIQIWWAFWDFNNLGNWTFLTFSYVLSIPIGTFVATHFLVPANRSDDMDWRTHFFDVRTSFFLAMIATVILAVTLSWSLLGASLLHPLINHRFFSSLKPVAPNSSAWFSALNRGPGSPEHTSENDE